MIAAAIKFLSSVASFFVGLFRAEQDAEQRDLGAAAQRDADNAATIAAQRREMSAAVNESPDAVVERLRKHSF